jgi:hypothetical protein
MLSVAGTLSRIDRFIPRELVAEDARARIESIAERLPAQLASCVYIECRLAESGARTDLIVGVDRRGRSILSGDHPLITSATTNSLQSIPAGVADLCAEWHRESGRLHEQLERIWLEYDIDANVCEAQAPVPRLFFDFVHDTCASIQSNRRTATLCVGIVAGEHLARRFDHAIERCLKALPPDAFVPYVGWFPKRQPGLFRLCIAGVQRKRMLLFLQSVGRSVEAERLLTVLGALAPFLVTGQAQLGVIHLDVGDDVQPGIALELLLDRRAQVKGVLTETALLERMVQLGLCAARKASALAAWPGCSVERLPHEFWRSVVVRGVNHIKLVVKSDMTLEAKAYLSVQQRFLSRRRIAG